jgi:hypothetical protein
MKKFIALLFLSLFVSQINAAMMPVEFNMASNAVVASGHEHCQDAAVVTHTEDGKSSGNANATHYCCAVVAILITPPKFFAFKQVEAYLPSDPELLSSKMAESIYKPPRNFL